MSYEGHIVKRQRLNDDHSSTQEEYPDGRKYREPEEPNKVLLFTILNAVYPITTEVLHTICNPCGEVQRIVIFRKRGVQAMVEFDSIQSAQRAKASLNGADIYSGCCTLKIEWAKPATLNVYKNNDETWDYTTPAAEPAAPAQAPLLGDAPAGYAPTNAARYSRPMPGAPTRMGGGVPPQQRPRPGLNQMAANGGMQPGRQPRGGALPHPQPVYDPAYGGAVQQDEYAAYHHPQPGHPQPPRGHHDAMGGMGAANGGGSYSQSPVLMIYGLSPSKMNCQKVFNVLCLFGNVMKVKFLKSKPGTAMAQLGDASSVDRAIAGLSGMKLFDEKLVLSPSKQLYLTDSIGPKTDLDDGTPTQEDFSGSRNNRFMTTKQAEKNREQFPSKVLHFYNAPVDFDHDKLNQYCGEMSVEPPQKFHTFKGKSDRSSSGLMEFETKAQALECLSAVNHYQIENPGGRYPFILKLCFSSATSINSSRDGPRD